MAKAKTVYRYRSPKKRTSRRRGAYGTQAMMKPAIDGVIAGIAPGLVRRFAGNVLGQFTDVAALGAVGYFRKNPTLIMLAGYEAGQLLGRGFGAAAGGNGNGFFEE